jgi:hypothetical protein
MLLVWSMSLALGTEKINGPVYASRLPGFRKFWSAAALPRTLKAAAEPPHTKFKLKDRQEPKRQSSYTSTHSI